MKNIERSRRILGVFWLALAPQLVHGVSGPVESNGASPERTPSIRGAALPPAPRSVEITAPGMAAGAVESKGFVAPAVAPSKEEGPAGKLENESSIPTPAAAVEADAPQSAAIQEMDSLAGSGPEIRTNFGSGDVSEAAGKADEIFSGRRKRKKESRSKSERDLLNIYLKELSNIPRPSVEKERRLAGKIELRRSRLQEQILSAGIPLARAAGLLERVCSHELDRHVELLSDANDMDRELEILDALELAVPNLHRRVKDMEEGLRASQSKEELRLALERAQWKSEQSVSILGPISIRIPRLYSMVGAVRKALVRIETARLDYKRLRAQNAKPDEIEQARQRLLEAQTDALGTPRMLRRYLRKVAARRREYEEAKRAFLSQNLQVVVPAVKRFRETGVPLLDLIQECNRMLIKLLDRYEGSRGRGRRFGDFARRFIRRFLEIAAAGQSQTVRVPFYAASKVSGLLARRADFFKRNGREPTLKELAKEAQLDEDKASRLMEFDRMTLSLDHPLETDGKGRLINALADPKTVAVDARVQEAELSQRLARLLRKLSFREREILRLRYGLADGNIYKLEEIGRIFNVSHEYIRQIEVRALHKLRELIVQDLVRVRKKP